MRNESVAPPARHDFHIIATLVPLTLPKTHNTLLMDVVYN